MALTAKAKICRDLLLTTYIRLGSNIDLILHGTVAQKEMALSELNFQLQCIGERAKEFKEESLPKVYAPTVGRPQ